MYSAYRSQAIRIGALSLGGTHPVRLQSMTNTPTDDTGATLDQSLRMIDAGAELVRMTTQGAREVNALAEVRRALRSRGIPVPVVADVHFRPKIALEAARVADKVRINPGNFLGKGPGTGQLEELLSVCRDAGSSLRIGVNHGSLDASIMEEYGDTPEGMAESAMRFLRICRENRFDRVVVSLKSSRPRVMIQSVRLMASAMARENMAYPLHLGVTEAGAGIEGIIRSATGIAPLLTEGLGDTIRVSLTGPPEEELPVARLLLELFGRDRSSLPRLPDSLPWDPFHFRRRKTRPVSGVGGEFPVRIVSRDPRIRGDDPPASGILPRAVPYDQWKRGAEPPPEDWILLLEKGERSHEDAVMALADFCSQDLRTPVLYRTHLPESDPGRFRIALAGELGLLMADGAVDAVAVDAPNQDPETIREAVEVSLQASGARISRMEYIACPSCGRTHFDILARLAEVRDRTAHLVPLKIAVMGCIVNGPGEMADADYGYVGAGPGKITLYRGNEPVRQNLPEEDALDALVRLLKEDGRWSEPPPSGLLQ